MRGRDFCIALKKDIINIEYIKQVIRSSSSIEANYIEANENLGEKDLKMRIRICRKESKETRLWLKHLLTNEVSEHEVRRMKLIQEATELMNIYGSILKK